MARMGDGSPSLWWSALASWNTGGFSARAEWVGKPGGNAQTLELGYGAGKFSATVTARRLQSMLDTFGMNYLPSLCMEQAYMLASHVISGRRGDAYRIMEELFEERTEPVAVLAIMSGAFIDLYRAKLASNERKNADDMAALFGEEYKGKEKRLSFSFRDCRRYSPELLRKWCCMLCNTDAALKSSRVDGKIWMEKLLAEMFAAAEAAR